MVDAVVIGAGPNGLVAANLLADHGWEVLLLEANREAGGAVRSAEDVEPGFVHDTFSAFYPLGIASPALRDLRLEDHGLHWCQPPAPVGNPLADGGWALVRRSVRETAASLGVDGDAWTEWYDDWRQIGPDILGGLFTPFPPIRHGLRAAARLARRPDRLRLLLAPARSTGEQLFRNSAARLLLATNALHADVSPESPGSGFFGWLLVMLAQQYGYPVPRGGAGELSAALARRFEKAGGTIQYDARVDRIIVQNRRATAVRTTTGEQFEAPKAVIADVSAPQLYHHLIPAEHVPDRTRKAMERFEWDPGTIKVDWALSSPIPWSDQPAVAPGTVHIAHSVDELTMTAAQIAAGAVPSDPFLVMGQMTTSDPTRSPAGTESAWAYTHVPQRVRTDAGDGGIRGDWDDADAERMADRMQARIEAFAPGFESRIIRRRILTPIEMERRDANLVGGALNGGTAALHQQLIFRPVPGLGRPETPIRGLYLGSASAHPGGGVHGACGANAARAALLQNRVTSLRWGTR